jgi:hypothetical protein
MVPGAPRRGAEPAAIFLHRAQWLSAGSRAVGAQGPAPPPSPQPVAWSAPVGQARSSLAGGAWQLWPDASGSSGFWSGRLDSPRPRSHPGLGCQEAPRPSHPPARKQSRRALGPPPLGTRGPPVSCTRSRCRSHRSPSPSAMTSLVRRTSLQGRTARRPEREGRRGSSPYLRPTVRWWLAAPGWRSPGWWRGGLESIAGMVSCSPLTC